MLNKAKVIKFRGDFEKAVAQLEKDYGVNISLGNIRFTSTEIKTKMLVKVGDKVASPIKSDFQVGDIVTINHKSIPSSNQFKIIKINAKNIKVEKIVSVEGNAGAVINVSPGLLIKI